MEWHDLRRGRPTASEFGKILTPVKRQLSASADEYIHELVGALVDSHYPHRAEAFTSRATDWGHAIENEARAWYWERLPKGQRVEQVGFCTTDDGRFGASPDGLIFEGETPIGGLELKCPESKTQIARALGEKVVPSEHKNQIHGGMIVTGLPWWDYLSYHESKPESSILVRIYPDNFTDALRIALEQFWERFQSALAKVKAL